MVVYNHLMNTIPTGNTGDDEIWRIRRKFGNEEIGEHFRSSIIVGVQMQMAALIDLDGINVKKDANKEKPIPIYVQLSVSEALTEDRKSLDTTLTMCRTNPEPMYSRLRNRAYHEQLFIHVPYKGKLKPSTTKEFAANVIPNVIYLEYHTPESRGDGFSVVRYVVTPEQISPYKSYEAGEVQQDEVDMFMTAERELESLYLSDRAAANWVIKAMEDWEPTPITYITK